MASVDIAEVTRAEMAARHARLLTPSLSLHYRREGRSGELLCRPAAGMSSDMLQAFYEIHVVSLHRLLQERLGSRLPLRVMPERMRFFFSASDWAWSALPFSSPGSPMSLPIRLSDRSATFSPVLRARMLTLCGWRK